MFAPQSIELTTRGRPIRFHLFSTGAIAARWSDKWQPIWVLAIEHPEGAFLVDSGIRADTRHLLFKFKVTRDEEVDRQLERLNIKTSRIKTIILTHHHFDHTGGLRHFPNTPIGKPDLPDLTIIPTTGHTKDHCSVLAKTDTHHILFAGDMVETQEQFLKQNHPFKIYDHPIIFLPTHDPESAIRLANLIPLPPSPRP